MDRIKKIKIKQQDGTMSDYYPIGADASNIDINYNNSTLEVTMKKTPRYYENVASMKLDDTLQEGDMAITLGYYTANDGGGAEYNIVNGEYIDDGGKYHQLINELFAELIIKNKQVSAQQIGIKSISTFDCTPKIKTFFLNNDDKITLFFPAGNYYLSECFFSHDYSGKIFILGQSNLNHTYLTYFNAYENNQKYIIKMGGLEDYTIPEEGSRSNIQVANCFIHKIIFHDWDHPIYGTTSEDVDFGILALDQCYSLSLDIGFRYCKGQCIYIRDTFEVNMDHLYFRDGDLNSNYSILYIAQNTKSMSNNNNSNITINFLDIETLNHAMILNSKGSLGNCIIDNIILEETGNDHKFNYEETLTLIENIRNEYNKHPYFCFDIGSAGSMIIGTWSAAPMCNGYWTDENNNKNIRSVIKLKTSAMRVVFNEIEIGGTAQTFPFFEADFQQTFDNYFYKKPWWLIVHNLDINSFCGTQDNNTASRYYFTTFTQAENSGCVFFDISSNGIENPDLITYLPSKMYIEKELFKLAKYQMNILPAAKLSNYPNCKNNYLLKLNKTGSDFLIKILPIESNCSVIFSGCTTWQSSTTITQGHCFELELYNNNNVLLDTLIPTDHDIGRYQPYKENFVLDQTLYPTLKYIKINITNKNYLDYLQIK